MKTTLISQPHSRIALLGGIIAAASSLLCGQALAANTTLTGESGGSYEWNEAGNWSGGVPAGDADVVIGEGIKVSVTGKPATHSSGPLTLKKGAILHLPKSGSAKVVSGSSSITMHAGSEIQLNMNANIPFPPIRLEGDAAIQCLFGASDKQTDTFGAITGPHTLRLAGFNRHKYILAEANTFSKLIMDASSVDYCEVFARAPGALGTGDVILKPKAERSTARLHLEVPDTMADNATLHVNGSGQVVISAGVTESVAGVMLNGKALPAGTYTRAEPWISGEGTLNVAPILPANPAPAFGAIVPSGEVKLTWQNLAPKTGSEVAVDVWFGTDPKAMKKLVAGKADLDAATVKVPVASTYYWRVDSHLSGTGGEAMEGTLFSFEVNDTDGDGFLDSYELAHTNPASRTALNPSDDTDSDLLTNMEEFRLGTNPVMADTDGDGLKDGPEVKGVGRRGPTNPLNPDSDGDGLNDGVESNSGAFAGADDTGTDPARPDTDGDGLDDRTEVAAMVAGTGGAHPLKAEAKPVKVFILLGQSNMVGSGDINPESKVGTLAHAVKNEGMYPYFVDTGGKWATFWSVRDVFIMTSGNGPGSIQHNQPMSAGAVGRIGPEFGIAEQVRHAAGAPVMMLKSCIGNRSLGFDLLPPGSGPYEADGKVMPGYRGTAENPEGNGEAPTEGWYPGIQYDGDTACAKKVLAELDTYCPGAEEYEIAGFFFWQGDKDRYAGHLAERYEQNLVRLIKALRKDFNAPDAPFVCATLGQTKKGDTTNATEAKILEAQLAVDGSSGKHPEFKGNVATVYSHPLSKGGGSSGHYGNDARTYMNVGEAMGKAMVELMEE